MAKWSARSHKSWQMKTQDVNSHLPDAEACMRHPARNTHPVNVWRTNVSKSYFKNFMNQDYYITRKNTISFIYIYIYTQRQKYLLILDPHTRLASNIFKVYLDSVLPDSHFQNKLENHVSDWESIPIKQLWDGKNGHRMSKGWLEPEFSSISLIFVPCKYKVDNLIKRSHSQGGNTDLLTNTGPSRRFALGATEDLHRDNFPTSRCVKVGSHPDPFQRCGHLNQSQHAFPSSHPHVNRFYQKLHWTQWRTGLFWCLSSINIETNVHFQNTESQHNTRGCIWTHLSPMTSQVYQGSTASFSQPRPSKWLQRVHPHWVGWGTARISDT